MVNINEMHLDFVPGKGTTDTMFVVRHLQEKYITTNKLLYFAFVDLKKAFYRVPKKVLWWVLRCLRFEEWAVRVIQVMFSNAQSHVRANGQYREEFGMEVGVHQGSVLGPLLSILPLVALSREFHTGVPWFLRWLPSAHHGHRGGVYVQAQGMEGWHGK